MQIGITTIPSHQAAAGYGISNLLTRQASFLCRRTNSGGGSLLNPNLIAHSSSSSVSSSSQAQKLRTIDARLANYLPDFKPAESSIKTHLSNLEKLFTKQSDESDPQPKPPLPHHTNHHHDDSSERNNTNNNNNKGSYKGLLEALNLSRIWPEVKAAAEEMSPRNLNRLQRLLLTSPEYSPRNNLGSRWLEYHGSNDWAGLLDPLDENLRREIVRYGEFIQAAYHAFHSDPATSADEAPLPRHVSLQDKSYKVTKSLYATSSIGLPKWVDDVAPDLGWMTQRSSWIGYVAVCDDKREIERMGRRDIVIAFRGTSTCLEWAENVRDVLVRVDHDSEVKTAEEEELNQSGQQLQAKVECGFWNLYKTSGGSHIPSLSESVTQEVRRLMELYKGESLSITVTGHSLGAALSILAADELSQCVADSPPIAVFSFGGPRVGNRGFANRIKENGVKVLRVVNSQDMITRVPGMFVNEDLDHKLREEAKTKTVLDILDNNMPWAYSHVGSELRVDSKMSPFLKPNADVACCHDLEAYLHLVDGFLASDCPFRANAKRSLVKLLHEQGSNVKKLYTSKAKSLMSLSLSNLDHSKAGGILMPSCLPSPS
ncbi:Lipase [Macleaya cordata]|uniref:Lipase n=1 Tax=Macleaya cordata TaxID=56857 RepID=A0A200R3F3_MACCD|nr:Lipase [Macleaya cordata]